jgi:3-hydroxybutyrate dehydrogenase
MYGSYVPGGQSTTEHPQRLAAKLDPHDHQLSDPSPVNASTSTRVAGASGNAAAVAAALERFARLDVVAPGATVQHLAPIGEFALARSERIVAQMLSSPFLPAKSGGWPARPETGSGRFIALGAVHGLRCLSVQGGVRVRQAGLLGLAKTLTVRGAGERITTAVCPGYGRTPLVQKQIADQAPAENGCSRT